jgi:hypothetical protein
VAEEAAEETCAADVEVRKEGAIGFMQVDVTFQGANARAHPMRLE